MASAITFDPESAYIAVYTPETQELLDRKQKGRPKYRYDVVRRKTGYADRIIVENLTFNQLQTLRSVAEAQGTKIW